MKKIYLTPKVKSLDFKIEKVLLIESGVGGGGYGGPGAKEGDEEEDF